MNRYLSSCVAIAALIAGSGAAFAADLPSRTVVPVAPVIVPIFTWTGFYAGLNAGYGWNTTDSDYYDPQTGVLYKEDSDGGFVGGGQLGYNYEFGQFVGGVEVDLQYADLSSSDRDEYGLPPDYARQQNGVEWFGTLRARLGFAFDRALIYATGGFAFGGGGEDDNYYGGYYYDDGQDTATGWTVGGGLEYAFTDSLSAKIEGLYVNLGGDDKELGAGFYPYEKRKDNEFAVVRAGINYKFSGF
ncbi:outer membrane protein [Chelatococcus sp. GCM10030263]|uniref:outer membrane protein n=1 Tax=Chelatococcus sp. GCM10030263 TaxID=3273387 RepID=UPI003612D362